MANNQYYLKDKKVDIYEGKNKTVSGVTKTTYEMLYPNIWAYYRQDNGTTSLTTSMTIKVYDTTERALFVINKRKEMRKKTVSLLKLVYDGRIYDIERIDDYEGNSDDYKLTCKYSSKTYPGITI